MGRRLTEAAISNILLYLLRDTHPTFSAVRIVPRYGHLKGHAKRTVYGCTTRLMQQFDGAFLARGSPHQSHLRGVFNNLNMHNISVAHLPATEDRQSNSMDYMNYRVRLFVGSFRQSSGPDKPLKKGYTERRKCSKIARRQPEGS